MEINKTAEKKIEKEIAEYEKDNEHYNEKDLHPLLAYFLKGEPHFGCFAKTIDDKTTSRREKGETEWLHPDMVGIHFPFADYCSKTFDVIKKTNAVKYNFYSFEIKKKVTFATLRKYYFQAVSNSSWANEGYLVALEYQDSDEFIDELKRLAKSFGIGFIKLNAEAIDESKILIPAAYKKELDWDTIDRLVEKNNDFSDFIVNIKEDIHIEKAKSNYDRVLSEEEIKKYIDDKQIKEGNK